MHPPLPHKDDRVATWAFIEARLEETMRNTRQDVDTNLQMGMYRAVHNFCTLSWTVPPNITGFAAYVHCGDLYAKLRNYLAKHLDEVYEKSQSHADEALVGFYVREWKRYVMVAKQIDHWFGYLNKYWIEREIGAREVDVYDIFLLHFIQWRDVLLPKLSINVMAVVLRMVQKQRHGETIQSSLIKTLVISFLELDVKVKTITNAAMDTYVNHFEKPFLEDTTQYYQRESARYACSMNAVEYMERLKTRMDKEEGDSRLYLIPESIDSLINACLVVSVSDYPGLVQGGFKLLLDTDQQDGLAWMYRRFSKTLNGLVLLQPKFEAHVRLFGQAVIDIVAVNDEKFEPEVYVDTLYDIFTKFEKLVDKAFAGHTGFVRSLHTAIKELMERNKFCKTGSYRSPELLARYTDAMLKREKNAETADFEKMLAQFLTVLKFIGDKDAFQEFYSRMLAKRLVNSSSLGNTETNVINQLTKACGFEYTAKFQRMVDDNFFSGALSDTYNKSKAEASDEDYIIKVAESDYRVFRSSSWPLKTPTTAFIPPLAIAKNHASFETFYQKWDSRRKLTWLWDLCKGELQANYIKDALIPYTFVVSAFQIAILLLFNDTDTVTYDEAQEATKISTDPLNSSLGILVKAKVLIPRPKKAKPEPGTLYTLNYKFKSERYRVNLNIAVKSKQKKEAHEIQKIVDTDRKTTTQAAIVRIMKARKKMKKADLVQQTIAEVNFTPKISDIDKLIQQLIEKEYLELLQDGELGYLA